jgi:hypothetical protein
MYFPFHFVNHVELDTTTIAQGIFCMGVLIATKHEKKEQLQMQSRRDSMVFFTTSTGKDILYIQVSSFLS